MQLRGECNQCLSNDICKVRPDDDKALLKNVLELEIYSSEQRTRLMVGQCSLSSEVVALDYGKTSDIGSEKGKVGIHELRLRGVPTVSIDLGKTMPAIEASMVVTEALKAIDFKPR